MSEHVAQDAIDALRFAAAKIARVTLPKERGPVGRPRTNGLPIHDVMTTEKTIARIAAAMMVEADTLEARLRAQKERAA